MHCPNHTRTNIIAVRSTDIDVAELALAAGKQVEMHSLRLPILTPRLQKYMHSNQSEEVQQ